MTGTHEKIILAAFVGCRIRQEELLRYSQMSRPGTGPYNDCTEFIISLPALAENPETAQFFSITGKQKAIWDSECARCCIKIYLKDCILIGAHISKRLRTPLLTEGYETEPSKYDLRVIRCLLQTITEPIAKSAIR